MRRNVHVLAPRAPKTWRSDHFLPIDPPQNLSDLFVRFDWISISTFSTFFDWKLTDDNKNAPPTWSMVSLKAKIIELSSLNHYHKVIVNVAKGQLNNQHSELTMNLNQLYDSVFEQLNYLSFINSSINWINTIE